MRIATFNSNFSKGGIDLTEMVLASKPDIACFQRVAKSDLASLDQDQEYAYHFACSFANQPSMHDYGIATFHRKDLQVTAIAVTLSNELVFDQKHQGNRALICDIGALRIVNCLPCYPDDTVAAEAWMHHVQACFNIGMPTRSIIVGDFHYEDCEPEWDTIHRHGFDNKANHLNTFRTGNMRLLSLDKVYTRDDVRVTDVRHAINPLHDNRWGMQGMHWPLIVEIA